MDIKACSVRYLMEDRDKSAGRFLASVGWKNAEITFLAGDASFRRYRRLTLKKRRAILMDAPPPMEDVRPFIRITKHLNGLGYSVPEIMAKDINSGFLLLEDMGDVTYTNVLAKGANEKEIYSSAIDVLADLHCRQPQVSIPNEIERYDESKLLNQAALFVERRGEFG